MSLWLSSPHGMECFDARAASLRIDSAFNLEFSLQLDILGGPLWRLKKYQLLGDGTDQQVYDGAIAEMMQTYHRMAHSHMCLFNLCKGWVPMNQFTEPDSLPSGCLMAPHACASTQTIVNWGDAKQIHP